MVENPIFLKKCSNFIEDYKHLLEDHGVNFEDVFKIAEGFDSLR